MAGFRGYDQDPREAALAKLAGGNLSGMAVGDRLEQAVEPAREAFDPDLLRLYIDAARGAQILRGR